MRTALCALALALLSSPSLAADLLVDKPGSGAPFGSIGAAVIAAQPGDVILVAAGTYSGFVVDKAVTILGNDKGPIFVQASKQASALRIVSIPAGATALVADLTLLPESPVDTGAAPLADVDTNAGTVILQNLRADQQANPGLGGSSLRVNATARAIVLGCTLVGFNAPAPLPETSAVNGGAGVDVAMSDVAIADSSITGGAAALVLLGGQAAAAGNGLRASGSSVRLANTRVLGGRGALSVFGAGSLGGAGAAGALLSGSTLTVAGGAQNRLQGGAGGSLSAGGAGLSLLASSNAQLASDAVTLGGAGAGGPAAGVSADASSTSTTLGSELPSLSVSVASGIVSFVVAGEPGVLQSVFVNFVLGPQLTLPGFLGTVEIPSNPLLRIFQSTPGSVQLPLPTPDPFINGLSFYLQSVQLGTIKALSNVALVTLP